MSNERLPGSNLSAEEFRAILHNKPEPSRPYEGKPYTAPPGPTEEELAARRAELEAAALADLERDPEWRLKVRQVEALERLAAILERLEEHHEAAAGATVKAARRVVRAADWMKGPEFLEMLQDGMKAAETIEKIRAARMPKARRKGPG